VSELIVVDSGLLLLLGTYVVEVRTLLLLILLVGAVASDLRSHRIPNVLVCVGLVAGVVFHVFHSSGWGFLYAVKGAAVGFALLIPLYALRAMGAGDVKLMAMVGAFLGPLSTVAAVFMSFLAGGLLALAVALWKRALPGVIQNTRLMLNHVAVSAVSGGAADLRAAPTTTIKLPYAIAIAAGTFTQILLAARGSGLLD
jgi:prepilin peptidase CpaA